MAENEVVENQEVESQSNEQVSETATQEQPSLVELDSLEKFRFQGRELTPKDLMSSVMMQSDYTRKTQEIAQERKYYENLQADLDYVKQNPQMIDQFKQLYPEKFHRFLGYVVTDQSKLNNQVNLPPDIMKRLDKIDLLEKEYTDSKVKAIEAELDAKFKVYSEKYPMADEEAVIARAQSLLDKGEKLTDKAWDTLWKTVNDKNQKLADKYYSTKVNQQKQVSQKSKDVSLGGGIPGQAPKMPRTIKEASEMALRELEN